MKELGSAKLVFTGCLLALLLSGCEAMKIASETKHDYSGVDPGRFNVFLYNRPSNAKVIVLPGVYPASQEKQLEIVDAACESASPVAKPPSNVNPSSLFLAPLAGILVVAGFSVIVSEAEARFSSYVDKRQGEFSKKFDRSFNVDYLITDGMPTFNCLIASVTPKKGQESSEPDFIFGAVLRSSHATHPIAYQWIPTYFALNRSSARTDKSGAVDVAVQIAINGVTVKGNETLSDVTIALNNVCLPDSGECTKSAGSWKSGQQSKDPLGLDNASPWFALSRGHDQRAESVSPCSGNCMPGSIRVTIIETGTGAANFGAAKTGLSNVDKALSDAIGKIIDLKAPKN
ncbi:hypothetical protein KDW54_17430 [Burkholderia ambifaria]|uniref:hypothetical protein n=1 Tax=Burkholderia ambifaria TaxID=152480 RepID=UPI001BA39C99|nr:hypothetical protein [Burkholderia ambifaria]MBR8184184.1 hypothetical protein [Burkholderia ambifaria]